VVGAIGLPRCLFLPLLPLSPPQAGSTPCPFFHSPDPVVLASFPWIKNAVDETFARCFPFSLFWLPGFGNPPQFQLMVYVVHLACNSLRVQLSRFPGFFCFGFSQNFQLYLFVVSKPCSSPPYCLLLGNPFLLPPAFFDPTTQVFRLFSTNPMFVKPSPVRSRLVTSADSQPPLELEKSLSPSPFAIPPFEVTR